MNMYVKKNKFKIFKDLFIVLIFVLVIDVSWYVLNILNRIIIVFLCYLYELMLM